MTVKKKGPKELPTFRYELEAKTEGASAIAGIDEVGRGPIAGPVVAAAVILPENFPVMGVDDSKRLTHEKRERLAVRIQECALSWSIGVVEPDEIDKINIHQASRLAMKHAVSRMGVSPDFLLIDGRAKIDMDINQRPIIKGDQLSISIAAASILAKVSRDRMMVEYHGAYPEYGFESHKGYATKTHVEAVRSYGPCPIHRKSFKTIMNCVQCQMFSMR